MVTTEGPSAAELDPAQAEAMFAEDYVAPAVAGGTLAPEEDELTTLNKAMALVQTLEAKNTELKESTTADRLKLALARIRLVGRVSEDFGVELILSLHGHL